MTKQEWQRCFEPAPDAFRACVRRALDNKEEAKVKKMIPRALALALAAVCMMASVALAAGFGVLDFLKVDQVGELKVSSPKAVGGDMRYVTAQVREAVCDGLSAHIVVAYTTKSQDDALINEFDVEESKSGALPFSSDRQTAKRTLVLCYNDMVFGDDALSLQAGYDWRYESARTLVIDYVIDLRDYIRMCLDENGEMGVLPLDIGDRLTLRLLPWVTDENGDTLEKGELTLTLGVPAAKTETWSAKNVPIRREGYDITSLTLVRTDMACYMTLSLHDDDPMGDAPSPMQRSLWFHVVNERGEAYALLNGGYKVSMDEENADEYVVIFLQRFEPGDTLRVMPYDSGDGQTWDVVDIPIEKQ